MGAMAFPQCLRLSSLKLLKVSYFYAIIPRESRPSSPPTPLNTSLPPRLIPSSHALPKTGAHRNPFAINKLRTLCALPKTGARRNPSGINRVRTLCKNAGGVPHLFPKWSTSPARHQPCFPRRLSPSRTSSRRRNPNLPWPRPSRCCRPRARRLWPAWVRRVDWPDPAPGPGPCASGAGESWAGIRL